LGRAVWQGGAGSDASHGWRWPAVRPVPAAGEMEWSLVVRQQCGHVFFPLRRCGGGALFYLLLLLWLWQVIVPFQTPVPTGIWHPVGCRKIDRAHGCPLTVAETGGPAGALAPHPLRFKNYSYIPRFLGRKHPKTSKIYYLALPINSSVLALCHWPPLKKNSWLRPCPLTSSPHT
jgi:hypothetical protein